MAFLSSPSSTNEVDTASIQVNDASTLVSTISAHDNTANLSDATVYAFLANQPNGSQLVHKDLKQIHEDDLEEMDLKWQLALLSMRARRSPRSQESKLRNQDNSRKTVIVEDTSFKAMVAIDGAGFDWSYMADNEVPTNMALMAFSDLDFKQPEFESYGPKASKRVCVETSNAIKKVFDTPIIKDWVSDCDEDESEELGDPQATLRDTGIFDSGCLWHITGNKSFLSDYLEYDEGFVAFAGSSKGGKITGKGKIRTGKLDFEDVCFMKELKFNLFSISQMCDKKNSVLFSKTECLILSLNFKLPDENQVLLKVSRKNNMYSFDLKNVVPSKDMNGNEFKNNEMKQFYRIKGIKREFSNARTPQQNGVAKRKNRTLIEAVRTMLADSMLPIPFWAEAVNTGCYVQNSKAFRVYNSITKRVEENLHVNFLENKPNVAGNGPEWLFDIDSLINSMNYQPVSVGNRTNGIACLKIHSDARKEGKEKVSDQEYILLPVLNTSSDVPSSNEEVVSSPKDNTSKKSTVEPTYVEGGKIDDLGCLDQQIKSTDDFENTNSTNSFNTASPTVNTASDKDGTFQKTYGEWNFSAPITVNVASSSFSHPAALDDFSKMLNLEDTGIFDDAYDDRDEGAEADYNNLDTVIPVSPIPSTRIHKDHPKEQIIGEMEPKKVTQALDDESWVEAIEIANLPFGKKAIGTKWVYRIKKDERGVVVRNKARLVSQGHRQEEGIDYDEIFAHVRSGYKRGAIDKTLFIKQDKKDIMLVRVYVDDIILAQQRSLGVKQKEDGIFISQDKYVAEILKKFDFLSMKTVSTPTETQKHLVKYEEAVDVFQVTPKTSHLQAVKRIFRYLKGQPKLCLWYPKVSSFDLESYSDSDYAGVNLDMKSTTGGCRFLGKRLISWQCKKQTIMATSTTEAEYVAAAHCCGQVLWIQNQLLDYRDILIPKDLPSNNTLLFAEKESFYFDILPFSRPPTKPPDGDTGILNINMMGDIFDQKAFMHKLMITLASHQEKYPDLLSHRCETVKKLNTHRSHLNECPMMIHGQNNPLLDHYGISNDLFATDQKFNFSRYILLSLVKNIEARVPFYMFPRFVQLIVDHQLGDMSHHQGIYDNPSLTKKVFSNMKRVGTGFFGVITPLFENVLVSAAEEVDKIKKLENRVHKLEEENRILKEKSFKSAKIDTTALVEDKEESFKQGRM
nr:hypothetical protein [Tanacetum cinerariifolium]